MIRTDKGNCPVLRIADKRMRSRSLRIGKEMLVRADKGDCPSHRIADKLMRSRSLKVEKKMLARADKGSCPVHMEWRRERLGKKSAISVKKVNRNQTRKKDA